jgi:hypothetical protein
MMSSAKAYLLAPVFCLALSVSPAVFASGSAVSDLNVQAVIVQPLTLNCNTRSLSFGTVLPGASGGTVRVPTTGAATYGASTAAGAGAPTAGQCSMTGGGDASYEVHLPASITLSNGSNQTMTVNNLIMSDGSSTGASVYVSALNNGSDVIAIGGDLVVPAGQKAGTYTGVLRVEAMYE